MISPATSGLRPALAVAAAVATVLAVAACGGSSSTPAADPAAGCAAYCSELSANCTAANAQFADAAACTTYCTRALAAPEFWSEGTAGATSGDSLACRTYHGGAPAVADPAFHCPHAGPTGGGLCGDLCENYCNLAQSLCTGPDQITFSASGCRSDCALFASGPNGATSGNTVQCRINHLGLIVAGGAASVHCGHARPVPTGACL